MKSLLILATLLNISFSEVPVQEIVPEGWLKEFLNRQETGLSGHPEALAYPYNTCLWNGRIERNSIGGDYGKDWWRYEQTAYYTDGILRLGLLTRNDSLVSKAENGIKYVLANVSENGRLGPKFKTDPSDQWPFAVYSRVLMAEYSKKADPAITTALERHYLSFKDDLDHFAANRNSMNIEGMLWTYSKTGNPELLEMAIDMWNRPQRGLNEEVCNSSGPVLLHGVSYAEEMKLPLLLYMYTGQERYLKAALNAQKKIEELYLLPDGVPASNEYLSFAEPENSHETCDIVDFTWTWGYFLMALGDSHWADLIENAVFNAGPGAVTKDFKALQYFSSVNQMICTGNSDNNRFKFGRTWMAYRPTHETECCSGNIHRLMPDFASRMWMRRSSDNAIVAAMYAPSGYITKIGRTKVNIREITSYPFDETIAFEFAMNGKARFPFVFRIPGWCREWEVKVNGEPVQVKAENGFATLERVFKNGDKIDLTLKMPVERVECGKGRAFFRRGPVLLSYSIPSVWSEDTAEYKFMHGKKPGNPDFKCWNIKPAGKWNYAVINEAEPIFVACPVTGYPFDPETPPYKVTIKVNEVDDYFWRLPGGKINPALPECVFPVKGNAATTLDLVPYGSTTLRLTVFPEIEQ